MFYSIFLHKYLCTQLFEAIVKCTKSRFQTPKTMFESWDSRVVWTRFLLKNPQDGTKILYVTSNDNARLPRNKHFVLLLLALTSLHFSRNDVKNSEKQNGVNGCVQCSQSDFFVISQRLWREFSWNHIKCKNNDQTYLFQCINICRVPGKKFELSA